MKKLWAILFYRTKPEYTNTRNKTRYSSQNNIRNLLGGEFRNQSFNFSKGKFPYDTIQTALERIGFLNYAILDDKKNVMVSEGGPTKDFIVVLRQYSPAPDSFTYNGTNFILDSSSIGLFGDAKKFPGAEGLHAIHAISGFKCGSDFYILDSNMKNPYKCDWRDIKNILTNPSYANNVKQTYGKQPNGTVNPDTKWNEGGYYFLIYVNSELKNSFKNYSEDIYNIRPAALKQRLKQTQEKRNNLARETKTSLRQEKANAEAGERISASMKVREAEAHKVRQAANAERRRQQLNETERRNAVRRARQAAQRQAAQRPKKSNEGGPSVSNAERRRQKLNETERLNAARRARQAAQRQAAQRQAAQRPKKSNEGGPSVSNAERRNAELRARNAAVRAFSSTNLMEMGRINKEAPPFIKNKFFSLNRLMNESSNRLTKIGTFNNRALNNFILQAQLRKRNAIPLLSWTHVKSDLEQNVRNYINALAAELTKAKQLKNKRRSNLKGKGRALN
jgi:hypothetical protein